MPKISQVDRDEELTCFYFGDLPFFAIANRTMESITVLGEDDEDVYAHVGTMHECKAKVKELSARWYRTALHVAGAATIECLADIPDSHLYHELEQLGYSHVRKALNLLA